MHNTILKRRKREPMATGFCDLPELAVAEIMSWLPPESLVQSMCVQKSWHAFIGTLIKTRWFVAKHVKDYGSRSSFLFLRGNFTIWTKLHMPNNIVTDIQLVNSYNVCNENDQIHFNSVELSSTSIPEHVKVSYTTTHCNGIIFQVDFFSNKITLCNPTTREFKYLDPDSSCFFGRGCRLVMAGFGYDAIADVYKVVRVVRRSAFFGAEVCTLGTNHVDSPSWRKIRMINIGNYTRTFPSRGVYGRGFLYWVLNYANRGLPYKKMIISFDMHAEEFRIVPLPMEFGTASSAVDGQYKAPQLMGLWIGVWNECVTLLEIPSPVKMWTMKTESSSSSCGHERFSCWVKHVTFSPPLETFQPKQFLNNDELLLSTGITCSPVSYNLRTHEVRAVQLHPRKRYRAFTAIVYVKSLVSFNN